MSQTYKEGGYPEDWESRRMAILHRDGGHCQVCGDVRPQQELHVHHKQPVSEGGTHELENLELRCADCHAEAHNEDLCVFCFLIGGFQFNEVKAQSSVGAASVCNEHLERIKKRIDAWDVDKVCLVCRRGATGRYALVEGHNTRGIGSGNLCSSCRIDIVNAQGGLNSARRDLQQQFEQGAINNE